MAEPRRVKNITNLHRHASKRGAVRVGATNDPDRRAREYRNDGYHGKMYYTYTSNMRATENRLLRENAGRHNVHKTSNAAAKPGYVYSWQGQKRRK